MNLQRINELYDQRAAILPSDADNLQRLITEYPFYGKPYAILARYYFESGHYRFPEMLRQAAMRISDRKALYYYIHGFKEAAVPVSDQSKTQADREPETEAEFIKEPKPGIEDFLQDEDDSEVSEIDSVTPKEAIPEEEQSVLHTQNAGEEEANITETESVDEHNLKPAEFEFEGHFREHTGTGQVPMPEMEDIIVEEIATEFSFSGSVMDKESDHVSIQSEGNAEPESGTDAEGDISGLHTSHDSGLRKYPVYSIEGYLEKDPEKKDKSDNSEPSKADSDVEGHGTNDFLFWLNHPEKTEPPEEEIADKEFVRDNKTDLIDRFITLNPQISRPKKEFYNPENMAKRSELPDLDFVTETLAGLYYEQGNLDLALKAYEKLGLQNPSKQAYFADLIKKIKKEKK